VNGTDSNKNEEQITDGVDQLLDLMHILILAVNQNTLWLSETASQGTSYYLLNLKSRGSDPDHKVFEIAAEALISIVEMTEMFPFIIKVDLYGGIYSIYDSTRGATE